MRGLLAVIILDLKRLWVDRIRLVTSLIQPLLYLFVLGSGLGASSTHGSGHYLPFVIPGRGGVVPALHLRVCRHPHRLRPADGFPQGSAGGAGAASGHRHPPR